MTNIPPNPNDLPMNHFGPDGNGLFLPTTDAGEAMKIRKDFAETLCWTDFDVMIQS